MTVQEHGVVKPEKIAATAVGALDEELVLPSLFVKHNIEDYKGSDDDTLSFKIEGVLPHRLYGWRNDRSQPIKFDRYTERKIAVSFGGNAYSAVQMTDEQADMDMARWGKLIGPQSKAVARGLQHAAVQEVIDGEYEVELGDCEAAVKGSIIEARRVLNALHAPKGNRFMVVGTDWESLLLSIPELNLAQNVGDSEAQHQLTEATLGKRYGFTFVVDESLDSEDAYAFSDSGFVFLNAAPSVPASVKQGSVSTFEGVSIRWMQDYSADFLTDRSVVNTYYGFQQVKDPMIFWDPTVGEDGSAVVTGSEYNCRSIKLSLDGPTKRPAPGSELDKATGLSKPGRSLTGAAATSADD